MIVAGLVFGSAGAAAFEPEDLKILQDSGNCVRCDLREADLTGVELSGANLSGAQLTGAKLAGADLSQANLSDATLTGTGEFAVDLRGVNLSESVLVGADLSGADLRRALLIDAKLDGANMIGTRLDQANLTNADLAGANMPGAVLADAGLKGANLGATTLRQADLRRADLTETELTRADLREADLRGALLVETELADANLSRARLARARYEARSQPLTEGLVFADGLAQMRWVAHPHGLRALRGALRRAGLEEEVRQVTFAIKRSERRKAGALAGAVSFLLFELPTAYGMAPTRPLLILLVLIVLFAVPYTSSIYDPFERSSGIWRVWPDDRVHRRRGEGRPQRVTETGMLVLWWGLYFSLLSALNFGWRGLDIANWISRVHPREYTVRATGWVKTVSGIEGLLSLFLVVMWLATLLADPFG